MFIVTSPVSAGPHVLDTIFNPSLLPGPSAGQGAQAPLTGALFARRWTFVGKSAGETSEPSRQRGIVTRQGVRRCGAKKKGVFE